MNHAKKHIQRRTPQRPQDSARKCIVHSRNHGRYIRVNSNNEQIRVDSVRLKNIDMKTEFKGTKGTHSMQFSSGVCIGVGVKIDHNYYKMTCNTILPDTDKEYKLEKQEIESNMRLYSSAPELLENLIRLVDRMEENNLGHMSAVERAKEAINKAL